MSMSYRLKTIHYKNRDVPILLQNENGPCPLLAASNCLLLQGSVTLPAHAIRNNVTLLEDITNMLANHAMTLSATNESQKESQGDNDAHSQFCLNELVHFMPKFQDGMDVNLKFTAGCQGYEFTAELNVLCDMLGCKLVHGWLIDPVAEGPTALAVGNRTYNELMVSSIAGKEAELCVSRYQAEIEHFRRQHEILLCEDVVLIDLLDASPRDVEILALHEQLALLLQKQNEAQELARNAHIIDLFFAETSHQLTSYGLEILHTTLKEGELCVFFRNNHYGTITKHTDGQLYLLVTDLGYAATPSIVWEKLDVVDGDTEFCNSLFNVGGVGGGLPPVQTGRTLTPDQLHVMSDPTESDYQMALRLSMQSSPPSPAHATTLTTRSDLPDRLTTDVTPTVAALPNINGQRVEVGVPVGNSSSHIQRRPLPDETTRNNNPASVPMMYNLESQQEATDRILAMQLHDECRVTSSLTTADDEEASLRLAQQLQHEENQQAIPVGAVSPLPNPPVISSSNAPIPPAHRTSGRVTTGSGGGGGNCAIM